MTAMPATTQAVVLAWWPMYLQGEARTTSSTKGACMSSKFWFSCGRQRSAQELRCCSQAPVHLCAAGRSSWHTMKTSIPPTMEKTIPKTISVKKG